MEKNDKRDLAAMAVILLLWLVGIFTMEDSTSKTWGFWIGLVVLTFLAVINWKLLWGFSLKLIPDWKWRLGAIVAFVVIMIILLNPTLRSYSRTVLKWWAVVSFSACFGIIAIGLWFAYGREKIAKAAKHILFGIVYCIGLGIWLATEIVDLGERLDRAYKKRKETLYIPTYRKAIMALFAAFIAGITAYLLPTWDAKISLILVSAVLFIGGLSAAFTTWNNDWSLAFSDEDLDLENTLNPTSHSK